MRPCQSSGGKISPQFKAEAVQMMLQTGKPLAEVARDLRVIEDTLGNDGEHSAPRRSGANHGADSVERDLRTHSNRTGRNSTP
jgi:transposase-like protein